MYQNPELFPTPTQRTITMLEELNRKSSIPGRLEFVHGKEGFILAELCNPHSRCTVSLYGAHVLSFKPEGREDILWMSGSSFFEIGKPIRGGIPVCWPWFGAHTSDAAMPSHGFARISQWNVKSASDNDGVTELVLSLKNVDINPEKFKVQPFELELAVRCGKTLEVELATENNGTEDFIVSEALHSYFAVSDISRVSISGLNGAAYIDTVNGIHADKVQSGNVMFDSEVDRIYSRSVCDCIISDPGSGRRITVSKTGSKTTVVWNPWVAKAARMLDFGNEEYHSMVCVETANADTDKISIPPGRRHSMKTIISCECE